MKTVEECSEKLMQALLESEEYQRFEKLKAEMAKHPDWKAQVDDFRMRVYLIQNSNEALDRLDEMKKLFREKKEKEENKLIEEYLSAELTVCRILQKITMNLMKLTDIDIASFADVIEV